VKKLFAYFDDIATKKKLLIAFGAVTLMFVFIQVWTVVNLKINLGSMTSIMQTSEVQQELTECRVVHLHWVMAHDEYLQGKKIETNISTTHDNCCVGKFLVSERRNFTETRFPELVDLYQNLEITHKKMHEGSIMAKQLKSDGNDKEAIMAVFEKEIKQNHSITDSIFKNVLTELKKEESKEDILDRAQFLLISIIVLILLVITLSVVLTKIIVGQVLKPINKITKFAKRLEKGDMTEKIEMSRKDEFGELGNILNRMISKVQTVIDGIVEGSHSFIEVSEQLNNNSQVISEGASHQAASAEEVSASMEQMLANIEQNSVNAQETERIAFETVGKMKSSNANVQQAVDLMRQIVKKIKIVDDIAFQTNILALNASIEAHRAGLQGRGFG